MLKSILISLKKDVNCILDRYHELSKKIIPEYPICYFPEIDIVLYTENDLFLSKYTNRIKPSQIKKRSAQQVSLVSTIKNEEGNLIKWLGSIEEQTRLPDEFIIVDGGSTDKTLGILRNFIQKTKLKINLIECTNINIAQGRNIGIEKSKCGIIACTDAGCLLDPKWLEKIVEPFEIDLCVDVVAGFYQAICNTKFEKLIMPFLIPDIEYLGINNFLPASKSIAFKKIIHAKVGGYPEWLTFAGEDTLFDLNLRRKTKHWAFVPEAIVYWDIPKNIKQTYKMIFNYSKGDGEAASFREQYNYYNNFFLINGMISFFILITFFINPFFPIILIITLSFFLFWKKRYLNNKSNFIENIQRGILTIIIRLGSVKGYAAGKKNRQNVLERRYKDIAGNVLILAGVPFHDSGGGQRGTQIAVEFLMRNYKVTFVHKYPTYETKKVPVSFDIDYSLLDIHELNDFDLNEYLKEHSLLIDKTIVILEFPLKEFLPIANKLKDKKAKIVYDLIDDWSTSLGGDWYSPEIEKNIALQSDVLIASAKDLKEKLEKTTGREVKLVPNAVNLHLFDRSKKYNRPEDLPKGDFIICYIGSLWGSWFDWELLKKVANAYPSAKVVAIGDYREQCKSLPDNLYFLGLKPQKDLPAYLQHVDIAIIPFAVNKLTQTISPLKVFEYMAMGKPVVTTDLKEMEGMPYVYVSKSHEEFIINIKQALENRINDQIINEFIKQNSWSCRISQIMDAL